LGTGSFGQVWKGKWRGGDVAVKQIKQNTLSDHTLKDFWNEAALVAKLRPHTNIVQFLGVCLNPFCVVYEFLPKGDLWSYVKNEDNKVNDELALKWFR